MREPVPSDRRGSGPFASAPSGRERDFDPIPVPEYRTLALLVDDQAIVGEAVRRMLVGEADISLHYCAVAADAVSVAIRVHPTVILQDLVLADGDGLDVVRQFRANPLTAGIPIIVLSTKDDPLVKAKAFAIGANDYVVKLPDRAELIARLRYHSRAFLNAVQRDAAFRALHESQEQLMESNTSLSALNQQLNTFIGMAAHDLRNPLGIVLGFSKLLLRGSTARFTDQQVKFLATIRSSTEFMLRLVNDLLDAASIEAGKLVIQRLPTDLVQLVESSVALNRPLAEEKDIRITVSADPGLPSIAVDGHRIEQVLTNLLTNAIKFSHPQTSIDVSLRESGDELVLAVRDRGQGIPYAELDRLFLPFGVTSVQATHGEKSTGLGLMIAKKVVDAHRGRIWVESIEGEGSVFFVALPGVIRAREDGAGPGV